MNRVAGKDWYRNVFLKSDEWKLFRSERIAEQKGRCFICKKYDASNDVHHVWYGEPSFCGLIQFPVLCRRCHDAVHLMCKPSGARNESEKKEAFGNFLIAKHKICRLISTADKHHEEKERVCAVCQKLDDPLLEYDLPTMTESQFGKTTLICRRCLRSLSSLFDPSKFAKKSEAWKAIRVCFSEIRKEHVAPQNFSI